MSYISVFAKAFSQLVYSVFPPKENVFFEMAPFGATDWNAYFGNVEEAPPIPQEFLTALEEPCPFWPNKKVKETHVLVLIPKNVNASPFTLDGLRTLLANKLQRDNPAEYFTIRDYEDRPMTHSYWILMTKDVIPGSDMKSHATQIKLAEKYGYRIPKGIEAGVSILMVYFREGKALFSRSEGDFTRVQEEVAGWPVAIGCCRSLISSESFGLSVYYNDWDRPNGIACVREVGYAEV